MVNILNYFIVSKASTEAQLFFIENMIPEIYLMF